METPRILTFLAATLLCAASPHSLPAAEVVDISSFAPRDPNKLWQVRAERKLAYLAETAAESRERISEYVKEASEQAKVIEVEKAKEKAIQKAEPRPPKAEPRG